MLLKDKYWYNLGYQVFGNITYGFFEWICNRYTKDNLEVVYFISREGNTLHKMFESFKSAHPEYVNVQAEYLPASRRAYNIASITSLNSKEIDILTKLTYSITVADFFRRFGLEAKPYEELILQNGFHSIEDKINLVTDIKKLRKIIKQIKNEILEETEIEREAIKTYINQKGVFSHSRIGIVDVGWHGSIQHSLSVFFSEAKSDIKTFGYYLCTFPDSSEYINNKTRMKGYLCHLGNPVRTFLMFKACIELFEFAYSANLKPLERFEVKNGIATEVYNDSEIQYKTSQNHFVIQLQKGITDFLCKTMDRDNQSLVSSLNQIVQILKQPTKEDLENLQDLYHIDNFAGTPHQLYYIDKNRYSRIYFIDIIKQFNRSLWSYGYYKKANIIAKATIKLYLTIQKVLYGKNK